jgi:hypothetical protein
MTDDQVRRIALFFLFTLMDERVAMHAAQKAVAHLKATSGPNAEGATVIQTLRRLHDQHRKLLPRSRPVQIPVGTLTLPDGADFAPWIKFQKEGSDQEIVAVVLSKILSYADEDIADGLGVSLGTARYRIGKGVRQLGLSVKAKG